MINKKFYTLLLAACTCVPTMGQNSQPQLPQRVDDGAILHCWNWSFNNITKNLDLIARQGFKAVQTSPIQPAKQRLRGSKVHDWWAVYQPIDFKIADGDDTAFGTKAEFKAMCEAAEAKGIKVIVDVVANHLADNGKNTLSPAVPEKFRKPEYWHSYLAWTESNYADRRNTTWNTMGGLPDLNTENAEVQGFVLTYLQECVDCGADGFRFDAAKHISTPADERYAGSDGQPLSGYENNFWPKVVEGIKTYAQQKKQTLYIYGEVLDNATGNNDRDRERAILDSYQQYMSITANVSSNNVRHAVANNQAEAAKTSYIGLNNGASLSKAVLWAESHDTYANQNGESRNIAEDIILRTWALVGSRGTAPALYFVRPTSFEQALGEASQTGWTTTEVAAINRLKNATVGQGEYLSAGYQLVVNERGNHHAVIVALGGNRSVSNMEVHLLEDGTYVDEITQQKFTVSDKRLSGNIGGTKGIAVLRHEQAPAVAPTPETPQTPAPSTPDAPATGHAIHFNNETYQWTEVYAYVYADGNKKNAEWPGLKMTYNPISGLYDYAVPAELANGNVIFSQRGDNTHRYPAANAAGLTIEGKEKYFAANHSWAERAAGEPYQGVQIFFDPQGNPTWTAPNAHLWNDKGVTTQWPGEAMSFDATTGYYYYNLPADKDYAKVIVNKGDNLKMAEQVLPGKSLLIRKDGTTKSPYAPPFFAPADAQAITVTYYAENWDKAYAYVWNGNMVEPLGPWPGTAMTSLGNNYFSIVVPAGFEKEHIKFNAGAGETMPKSDDIALHGRDQAYTGLEGLRYHMVNVGSTGYATLYLDYATSVPEGTTVHTGKYVNDVMKLTALSTTLPALTPVVVKANATGAYKFVETKEPVMAVAEETNDLKGTIKRLSPTERPANMTYYILVREGEKVIFGKLAEGQHIPAYRAYMQVPQGQAVQAFSMELDQPTAIEEAMQTAPAALIYDLSGRRVQRLQSGSIYLQNGKKFVQP